MMQSPPGWRCPETAIARVEVGSGIAKEVDEAPMAMECSHVQSRCSFFVRGVDEIRIGNKHLLCAGQIPRFNRGEEISAAIHA